MGFKIGDKVRLKAGVKVGERYNGVDILEEDVLEYAGKNLTITRINGNNRVWVNDGWRWNGIDAFELVEPERSATITVNGNTIHCEVNENGDVTLKLPADAKLEVERIEKEAKEAKFDFEKFKKNKQSVNCKTEEEAKLFFAWLAGKGFQWDGWDCTDKSLLCGNTFCSNDGSTYYCANGTKIQYGSLKAVSRHREIIPFTIDMLIDQ